MYLGQEVCEFLMDFRAKRGSGDVDEHFTSHLLLLLQLIQNLTHNSSHFIHLHDYDGRWSPAFLKVVSYLQRFGFRKLETFCHDARMKTLNKQKPFENIARLRRWTWFGIGSLFVKYLADVHIRLLEEFADDQHVRSGSVACDVILCCRNARNERRCRVLNLLKMNK